MPRVWSLRRIHFRSLDAWLKPKRCFQPVTDAFVKYLERTGQQWQCFSEKCDRRLRPTCAVCGFRSVSSQGAEQQAAQPSLRREVE